MPKAVITPWAGEGLPDEGELRRLLRAEGLDAYRWSNRAGDRYAPHRHPYDKVIICVRGSIQFTLPEAGHVALALAQGDRLDLPAGTLHAALVGEGGVVCLEAHR